MEAAAAPAAGSAGSGAAAAKELKKADPLEEEAKEAPKGEAKEEAKEAPKEEAKAEPKEGAPAGATKRPMFVGGNWKCKGTKESIIALCAELNKVGGEIPQDVEVVIFPSFLHIGLLQQHLGKPFLVGAQNCFDAGELGEYTGCVTPAMLADYGVRWVLLGHSDRRNSLLESSELIAAKAGSALKAGMSVNLTVGETRAQRDAGEHMAALEAQLAPVAKAVPAAADWERIVVAYEPVWAIGEGATPCSPAQAQEVHAHMRAWLAKRVGDEAAANCRIVYTGSVSTQNVHSYADLKDVDGFVVGRAALDASDLLKICTCRLPAAGSDKAA